MAIFLTANLFYRLGIRVAAPILLMTMTINRSAAVPLLSTDTGPPQKRASGKEMKDLQAIHAAADPSIRLDRIEQHLSKYPKSSYRTDLLRMAIGAYSQVNNHGKAVESAEKLLTEPIESTLKAGLYAQLTFSYSRLDNHAKSIEFGERLLSEFPDSPQREDTMEVLAFEYRKSNDLIRSIDYAERFVKEYPKSRSLGNVYRLAMFNFQALNNPAKCAEFGERLLEVKPGDVETLTMLAYFYGESARWEEAADRSQEALDLIDKAADPPTDLSPERWKRVRQNWKARNFSTLGACHLHRGNSLTSKEAKKMAFEDAVINFKNALSINPRDDISYLRMGLTYEFMEDWEGAQDAYAAAVALAQPSTSGHAGRALQAVYKRLHRNSLEGMETLIQKAEQKLKTATDAITQP